MNTYLLPQSSNHPTSRHPPTTEKPLNQRKQKNPTGGMSEGRALERDTELRKAISLAIESGYQIDREAFELLRDAPQPVDPTLVIKSVLEEADGLPERPLFINRELVEKKMGELFPSRGLPEPVEETGKISFRPYAKEVEADLKVLDDPTNKINATGSLEDYVEYFQDRFRRLRRIMNNRLDVKDACTIAEAAKAAGGSRLKMICMISEKRESKRGIFLEVEDLEGNATVFVPSENRELFQKAQRLVSDQVVCVCCVKSKSNLFVIEDIIFPDVPVKKPNMAPIPVYAALLSDLHVGSKMFMRETFQRFIRWLRGEVGDAHLREIASHVKYLVIAGDIVDGVGIYPEQIRELEIKDVYKQYQAAGELVEQVPEYVEVIVLPGNHDACRRALPQPAISKEYAEPLYESRQIHSVGSPSTLSLHGVNMLICHGRSLDDVVSTVPRMSFQAPDEAMKFLLQCRHLAPTYGLRALIAPDKEDHLVIEGVPDIFQAGHVHMMSYSSYRGILVVNSGAWQRQTEYQREMGHTPNPGIAPIVNLENLQVFPIDFVSTPRPGR